MSFFTERPLFEAELDNHYAGYPSDLSALERDLQELGAQNPDWPPPRRKAAGYQILSQRCPVHVFRHFPFYFELDVGKPRHDLGSGGVGAWMTRTPVGADLRTAGSAWWAPCHEIGLAHGWPVLDDNHHTLGYDHVLRHGLHGLIAQARARLDARPTAKQRAFLEAAIAGNQALIAIANRFAARASDMAVAEGDPDIRRRLERMAAAACRVPAGPPETFYEALNTILFMREVTQSLEGNGISVFGHLDRMLGPYYQADRASGRTTREEASDLLCFFLAFSDVRFGMRRAEHHVGTNTTVGIGGCDAEGNTVFNDVTRMIVEAYLEARLVDPKLNARISRDHPEQYFDLLSRVTASGSNSLCIFNDQVVIEANVKTGKARSDCRLYVGGGCQENVLENCEVNSRATMYLNLAQVFLMGFSPETWSFLAQRDGIRFSTYEEAPDFEGFYRAFLENLERVVNAHIDQRNRTEGEGGRYNPCPLHSSTLNDCIETGLGMMEGGARYNVGSVSLTGIGTLIDSLWAIRHVVFEQQRATLDGLAHMLAINFEGEEAFRQYLIHRVAKFGQEDPTVQGFSARVFADLARVASGRPNTRGGRYEASLFAFRSFTSMGEKTAATPDGRRAGEHLSPGMSPSSLALGQECSIGQVLDALEPLDLTDYPVVAVLDVKLPASPRSYPPELLVPLFRRFLVSGGSVLQANCVDPALLLEAKAHPERHPDLVVRVSGYSAYFDTLSPAVQDEVIARTLVTA